MHEGNSNFISSFNQFVLNSRSTSDTNVLQMYSYYFKQTLYVSASQRQRTHPSEFLPEFEENVLDYLDADKKLQL